MIKLGTDTIAAAMIGAIPVSAIYLGDTLLTGPSNSPEAQAVLDRMAALTPTEEAAIIAFVDGCVADENWQFLTEFYLFGLNTTDQYTGFISGTVTPSGTITDSGANGVETQQNSSHLQTNLAPAAMGATIGYLSLYVHTSTYVGTGNQDPFGMTGGDGAEFYCRHRGNDTNDYNLTFNHTAATPRPATEEVTQLFRGDVHSFNWSPTQIIMAEGPLVYPAVGRTAGTPSTDVPVAIMGRTSGPGTIANGRPETVYTVFCWGDTLLKPFSFRDRILQLLRDIGTTGVPA